MSNKNPLWMPEGSVRSILALFLTGATVVAVFELGATDASPLIAICGIVIKSYFDARGTEG